MNMQKMLKDLQRCSPRWSRRRTISRRSPTKREAGGGMVKVVMNGQGVLTSIKINPEAVDKDDVEALEDLVMAAVNSAVKKEDSSKASMEELTHGMGMNIPGMM